jgi:hypothetical protein
MRTLRKRRAILPVAQSSRFTTPETLNTAKVRPKNRGLMARREELFEMTDKQIADLQAQIDRLTAQQPTPIDHDAAARWRDRQREIADRRDLAGAKSMYSRAELAAFQAAAPDDVCREIALRDCRAPTSPSQAGASGRVERVSTNAGIVGSNTSGWRDAKALGPQPHISHVDRLMDEQDRRDKADLIRAEEARRRAEQKQR